MPETITPKTVSELTVNDIVNYLRISEPNEADSAFLKTVLEAAKAFVYKYTGLTAEQVDESLDITIAVYVLCQDMFDNRSLYVDNSNVNKVVEGILGLHSINLL